MTMGMLTSISTRLAAFMAALAALCSCTEENRAEDFLPPRFLDVSARIEDGEAILGATLSSGRVEGCGFILTNPEGLAGTYPCTISDTRFETRAAADGHGMYRCVAFAEAGGAKVYSDTMDVLSPFRTGDLVDRGGLGIVFSTGQDGSALIVSVEETAWKPWNMSLDWCRKYGDGSWDMPDISQLDLLSKEFENVNRALSEKGFKPLCSDNYCYWSSTPNEEDGNYYYRERLYDGLILNYGLDEHKESTANFTRAVKAITPYYTTDKTAP